MNNSQENLTGSGVSPEQEKLKRNKENSKDYRENARIIFDASFEAYYTCRSQILDLLKLSRPGGTQSMMPRLSVLPQQNPSTNRASFIKLPQCNIWTLSGSYEEWPAFRDLFTTACIENDEIRRAQKLFYLRLKKKEVQEQS